MRPLLRAGRVQQRGQSLPQGTGILRPKVRTEETVDEDRNPFETKALH
jgi:hypothetical protein